MRTTTIEKDDFKIELTLKDNNESTWEDLMVEFAATVLAAGYESKVLKAMQWHEYDYDAGVDND